MPGEASFDAIRDERFGAVDEFAQRIATSLGDEISGVEVVGKRHSTQLYA